MEARELAVLGTYEIVPPVFTDERGLIAVLHDDQQFVALTGHPMFPVRQCTHSRSVRGVVRGVHYTATPPGSAKYVHCTRGRALDIVVDLRLGSPTWGRWDAVELVGQRPNALFMPTGIGHAFVALEQDTTIHYMLSERFVVENEYAVSVHDPVLGLPLPTDMELLLSSRDREAHTLDEARAAGLLPSYEAALALDQALYAGLGNSARPRDSTAR